MPVGSRPSASICNAREFLTLPKVATPLASLPSTESRTAWVRFGLSLALTVSSEPLLVSPAPAEVVPPELPPPLTARITIRATTTTAPAASAARAPPLLGRESLGGREVFGLGAGGGAEGAAAFGSAGAAGLGGVGGGVGVGATGAAGASGAAVPGVGIEGAGIPSASSWAAAALARSWTSVVSTPSRALRSS